MKQFKVLLAAIVCLLFMYSCQDDEPLFESTIDAPQRVSHRLCDMHDHMQELLKDPEYKKAHQAKLTRLSEVVTNRSATCDNPPVIPVAIHFQDVTGDEACLVDLAQNQIDILNADFKGTNTDITEWTGNASTSFPGINFSETCLTFCLADQNHPSGYGLVEGEPAVTINATTGDSNSDFSGYLNIFVQVGTGVLGYSPLGGAGNGDGVVIEATAFGSGSGCGNVVPESPYNLGRTTTHEVGHYLLLDHIWGGGCNQDDDVADTPDSNDAYYDCPSIGESSCGSTDLHMNYMDYTNDACMYMFTEGQGDRSEDYVSSSLSILTDNAANVCSGDSGSGSGDDSSGCDVVENLEAEVLNATEVQLSWSGYADAEKYRVRYKTVVGGTYIKFNTTSTSVTLSSLQTDVEYQAEIRTKCSTGWTAWSTSVYFTPTDSNGGGNNGGQLPGCDVINDLEAEVLSATEVELSWTGYTDAIKYRVRYKPVVGGSYIKFNTTNTSEVLTSLQTDVEYKVQVRAMCDSGFTAWSTAVYFTPTDSSGGGSGNGNDVPVDSDCDADAVDSNTGEALTNQDCYDEVIANDSYCCDVEFDYLCQEAYDECVDAGGSNDDSDCIQAEDVYTGEILDDDCVTEVQELDSYCCDVEWDGVCQESYDECLENGFNMGSINRTKDALITVGQNELTNKIILTYAIKNWRSDTKVVLYDGSKELKSITVNKRRGMLEISNVGAIKNKLKSKLIVDNQVMVESGNTK